MDAGAEFTNESQRQLEEMYESLAILRTNTDHFFILVMAIVVFLMQLGFAFLEAGSVRAKNTTNILLKNMLDVCIGAVSYWAVGYAFAFGAESNPFIGYRNFFFENMGSAEYSIFFFHFVFAATAATIVSGAMAERTEFAAYFMYSSVITGFIYPIVTHWAWASDGWLLNGAEVTIGGETIQLSYQDFAGSGVVHCVGGAAALVGASILGPRIGRFDSKGNPQEIQGHTVPMVSLGGFILFFGFFAFNGGSQVSISAEGDGEVVALSFVNTIISGAFAALVSMILRKIGFKGSYWSLLTTINGGLTGMVAICAGCNAVAPWGAACIGAVAGMAYIGWSSAVVAVKVDDPLDAVAVHLGGGLWGVLAAPIFTIDGGIISGVNRLSCLKFAWNLMGVIVIVLWTAVISLIMFSFMHILGFLRVNPDIEMNGLDIPKHGEPAYPVASYGNGWNDHLAINTLPVQHTPTTHIPHAQSNGKQNGGFVTDPEKIEYGADRESIDIPL